MASVEKFTHTYFMNLKFIFNDLVGQIMMEIHFDKIYGPCWRCEGMGV